MLQITCVLRFASPVRSSGRKGSSVKEFGKCCIASPPPSAPQGTSAYLRMRGSSWTDLLCSGWPWIYRISLKKDPFKCAPSKRLFIMLKSKNLSWEEVEYYRDWGTDCVVVGETWGSLAHVSRGMGGRFPTGIFFWCLVYKVVGYMDVSFSRIWRIPKRPLQS